MKGKKKLLLTSALSIVMCFCMIVGGTFALFTSESKVNVAVTSGKVEVNAVVQSLTTYSMDYDNAFDRITAAGQANFENGGVAIWDELNGSSLTLSKITPGDKAEIVILVENNSNVNVIYKADLKKDTSLDENGEPKDDSLFDALFINYYTCDGNQAEGSEQWEQVGYAMYGYDNLNGYGGSVWSELASSQNGTQNVEKVKIEIEFPNGNNETDNLYQNCGVSLLYSVQVLQGNAPIPANEYITTDDGLTISGDGTLVAVEEGTQEVVIPSNVTSISSRSFSECRDTLQTVTISESVTEIGQGTFSMCSALETVEIPASVTTIGNSAFWNCTSLETVTIADDSQITTIPSQAFEGCENLTEVNLPDTVTTIGNSAFSGTSLESFDFTNIETVGKNAFYSTNLTQVEIPAGVTTIGNSAFSGCENLTTFTIAEDSTASIGEYVLVNTKVEEITIPENVTLVAGAFRQVYNLKHVVFEGEVTVIKDFTFADCKEIETITFKANTTIPEIKAGGHAGSNANGTSAFRGLDAVTFIIPNCTDSRLDANGTYVMEKVGYEFKIGSTLYEYYTTITVVKSLA